MSSVMETMVKKMANGVLELSETTLGEIASFEMGQAPPGADCNMEGRGTVFVKAGEFGDLYPEKKEWTTKPLKYGKDGDVFICVVGATTGKLNLGIDCAIGRSVAAIRPNAGYDARFVYYQLLPSVLRLRASSAGSAQGVLSKKQLSEIPFVVAPLPEQRRIVEAIELQLGRLDAAVARLQGARARLKRYKQAVLKAAYTGQLWTEGADMSDEAPLPEGWRWGTLGDFVKIRNGFAFKSTDYLDEGVLLIRQSNLGGEKVTTEGAKYLPPSYLDAHKEFQVHKGDILIGMSGSIGKLCTYDLDEPALQNQRTGLLQFKDPKQKPWVWNYLPMLEQSLLKQGKGVAVLNISAKQIEASPMPIPPVEVQARIIDEVEQRIATIAETETTLDAQLQQAVRLRQAVLKRAFEGRLV